MIRGNKASSYGVTKDDKGRLLEQEYRQCSHCQTSWIYHKGSGTQRGLCYHCNGLLCGRRECMMMDCLPFWDTAQERNKKYKLTESGVYIK
jgi:hypothetical protein